MKLSPRRVPKVEAVHRSNSWAKTTAADIVVDREDVLLLRHGLPRHVNGRDVLVFSVTQPQSKIHIRIWVDRILFVNIDYFDHRKLVLGRLCLFRGFTALFDVCRSSFSSSFVTFFDDSAMELLAALFFPASAEFSAKNQVTINEGQWQISRHRCADFYKVKRQWISKFYLNYSQQVDGIFFPNSFSFKGLVPHFRATIPKKTKPETLQLIWRWNSFRKTVQTEKAPV